MAVRPVSSRGGTDGTTYAAIAFAILAVAGIGAAIWLKTVADKNLEQARSAETRARQMGTPPAYYSDEATARNSSVGETMAAQISELARLVTGKEGDIPPEIDRQARTIINQVSAAHPALAVNSGDTLLGVVSKLEKGYATMTAARAQLQQQYDDKEAEAKQLADGNDLARKEYEQQIAGLKEDIARIETEKDEAIRAKDAQLAEAIAAQESSADELNRMRVERQARDREVEIVIARQKQLIDEMQAKIAEVRPTPFDVNNILTKADGRVLRAIPGSDVVYINLGSDDQVRAGMGFEVFSATGERGDDYRGKASVEVVTVLATTAECKIRRASPGRPIIEGDTVVNVAFERNRKTKFVVRGDFDLDYNGETDWDGQDRVSAMIREWGGQVVENVDSSVDFVVIGQGPQAPEVAAGRPVSAVVQELLDSKRVERREWEAIIEAARTRNIPILTQTQFLYLTGFVYGGMSL